MLFMDNKSLPKENGKFRHSNCNTYSKTVWYKS